MKKLLTPHEGNQSLGLKAMEDEIASTFKIEQIDTSRASVREILSSLAPGDKSEERVYAMKKGLEFIADTSHGITEENV